MQVVIDIDDELYQMCKDLHGDADPVERAIANGTPLPKRHGRLIDVDDKENLTICFDDRGIIKKIDAPTIIEADKESEEQA